MENPKIKYIFQKFFPFLITFIVSAAYLILAVVVIMFLFSSLHIVNPDIFDFSQLDFVTAAVTVVILIPSVLAFFKAFKKTYKYFNTIKCLDKKKGRSR
jgi:predicted ferric reductase